MTIPILGLCTKAYFIRVVDADTLEVEVRRRFKVRVKDLLCEEKSKPEGVKAKKFAESLMNKTDETLTVLIPHEENEKLMTITSFDRIIGQVWRESGSY